MRALESLAAISDAILASADFKASSPAPVNELTAMMGDCAAIEKRPANKVLDLEAHDFESFRIDGVGFREDGDAATDCQQTADIEVLASLRLDAFIGGNYEQDEVNSANASEHIAHETLMARNVDKSDTKLGSVCSGQVEVGKTKIDGDAASLFFFQAVGVNAGKGFDQRCFAVVDMPGGADDDGLHRCQYRRGREQFLSVPFMLSPCENSGEMRQ